MVLKYGLIVTKSPNLALASASETVGGIMTSSPDVQSIGVTTPLLSANCKESMTLKTSAEFLPVEAG